MKHAKKMVLVDINTVKSPTSTVPDKTVDNLTTAISSLASSNEFGRTFFGDSATSITHLDKEMNKILERQDLNPDTKLKLYHQKLKRYLFLQRESEDVGRGNNPAIQTPIQAPIQAPLNLSKDADEESVDEDLENTPPKASTSYHSDQSFHGFHTPVNSKSKQLKSKYRSNIPRTTPKEVILRDPTGSRPPKHFEKYFMHWGAKGSRKSAITTGRIKGRKLYHE